VCLPSQLHQLGCFRDMRNGDVNLVRLGDEIRERLITKSFKGPFENMRPIYVLLASVIRAPPISPLRNSKVEWLSSTKRSARQKALRPSYSLRASAVRAPLNRPPLIIVQSHRTRQASCRMAAYLQRLLSHVVSIARFADHFAHRLAARSHRNRSDNCNNPVPLSRNPAPVLHGSTQCRLKADPLRSRSRDGRGRSILCCTNCLRAAASFWFS